VANQYAATAQGLTEPAPICATLWGALQRRALKVATQNRNAPTAKETTPHSTVGAQRRWKPPERHG